MQTRRITNLVCRFVWPRKRLPMAGGAFRRSDTTRSIPFCFYLTKKISYSTNLFSYFALLNFKTERNEDINT